VKLPGYSRGRSISRDKLAGTNPMSLALCSQNRGNLAHKVWHIICTLFDAAIVVELWPGCPKAPGRRALWPHRSRRGVCRRDPPFSATEEFCRTGDKDGKNGHHPSGQSACTTFVWRQTRGRCMDSSFDCPLATRSFKSSEPTGDMRQSMAKLPPKLTPSTRVS
jgi:hypothetical protein